MHECVCRGSMSVCVCVCVSVHVRVGVCVCVLRVHMPETISDF